MAKKKTAEEVIALTSEDVLNMAKVKGIVESSEEAECECDHNVPTAEEISAMMTQQICTHNLEDIHYDEEEFQQGVKDYSRTAGKITALLNVGLTPEMALSYIVNMETAILTKEMNVEMAKETVFAKEKQEM